MFDMIEIEITFACAAFRATLELLIVNCLRSCAGRSVTRDREMTELDAIFPDYGFAQHKGYPTAFHLEKLAVLGATEHHRRSFAPVRRALESGSSAK